MAEILSTELKEDLLAIYKTTGDLVNFLDEKKDQLEGTGTGEIFEKVKRKLMDMEGTLQKDIFHCDYLITKFTTAVQSIDNTL